MTARIGLFGGTFDPPHRAHLALASLARDALALDELRWLPAGQPWQKAGQPLTPAEHRVAMVRLCIEGQDRFVLDDREVRRQGPSYTLDTVRELAAEQPGAEWFLIIGQDQYERLDTWHGWQDLLQLVTLAVAGREGRAIEPAAALAAWPHRMVPLALPAMPYSSTALRQAAARGQPLADLVGMAGPGIAGYIAHHHLYQGSAAAH